MPTLFQGINNMNENEQAGGGSNDPRAGARFPRRLLDEAGGPPETEWALRLLSEIEPTRVPAGRKQRVLLALGQPAASRRVPFMLRPAILAAVIGCAAIASAAFGHWPDWIEKAYRGVDATSATTPRKTTRTASRTVAAPPSAGALDVVPAPLSLARQPGVLAGGGDGKAVAAVVTADDPQPKRGVPAAPARQKHSLGLRAGEDSSAVSQSIRALRVEGDPAGARLLATRYLEEHPNGALAEEALAIAIEAAIAHHDPDAAALGARYLRLYPSGPFRSRAVKAGASSSIAP